MAQTDPARRRGVVMVITLIAVLLLVALILFVLNLGEQVERRIAVQNAADASAVAGAVNVARTLNTVADNNVAISRMIALVCVLDSFPRATAYALGEQTAFRDALDAQLARGVSRAGPADLTALLEHLLEDFLTDLDDEVDQLAAVDALFQSIDLTELTYYSAPGGMGRLWRAMYAIDEMNQAVLDGVGPFAQTAAVDGGRVNLPRHDAATAAFMVPVRPEVPWRRGTFNDFERPVRYGQLPRAVDDEQTHRGPYDTVFGWHHPISQTVGGTWVPGRRQPAQGGRGSVPIGSGGGGGGGGGHRVGGTTVVSGYATWGMFEHLLDRVSGFVADRLRNSRLSMWVRGMSDAKLNYLWPDDNRVPDDELAAALAPEWVVGWAPAIRIADTEPQRIKETGFIAIELKSKYPIGHPQFLADGTWAKIDDNGRWQPRLVRVRGWEDPRRWSAPRVADYGWRDEWQYTVWYDQDIDVEPGADETGRAVPQPVYRIDHFYFVGVNVGETESILDPFEGFNPDSAEAPAPSDLDHAQVTREPDSRRRYLTFLALAQRGDAARSWPSAFRGAKPYPRLVGLAQAKVFNNHSWDLWTPMWHARLEPISGVDDWAATMRQHAADLAAAGDIDGTDYNDLQAYLAQIAGLADIMMGH